MDVGFDAKLKADLTGESPASVLSAVVLHGNEAATGPAEQPSASAPIALTPERIPNVGFQAFELISGASGALGEATGLQSLQQSQRGGYASLSA